MDPQLHPEEVMGRNRQQRISVVQSPWKSHAETAAGLEELKLAGRRLPEDSTTPVSTTGSLSEAGNKETEPDRTSRELFNAIDAQTRQELSQNGPLQQDSAGKAEQISKLEISRPVASRGGLGKRDRGNRACRQTGYLGNKHLSEGVDCLGKRSIQAFQDECKNPQSHDNPAPTHEGHNSRNKSDRQPEITRSMLSRLCTLKMPRLSPRDSAQALAASTLYPQGALPQSESLLIDYSLNGLLAAQGITGSSAIPFIPSLASNSIVFETRVKQGATRARHSAQGALRKARATAVHLIQRVARGLLEGSRDNSARVTGTVRQGNFSSVDIEHRQNGARDSHRQMIQERAENMAMHQQRHRPQAWLGPEGQQLCMVIPGHSTQALFSNSPAGRAISPQTPEKQRPSFLWSASLTSAQKSVTQRTEASRGDRYPNTSKELLNSILAIRKQAGPVTGGVRLSRSDIFDQSGMKRSGPLESAALRVFCERSSLEPEDGSCGLVQAYSPSKVFPPFVEDIYLKSAGTEIQSKRAAPQDRGGNHSLLGQQLEPRIVATHQKAILQPTTETRNAVEDQQSSPILFRKLTF